MNYYDKILIAIPNTLILATGGLYTAGIDLVVAIPLGAIISIGLIGHALFSNPPVNVELDAPVTEPNSHSQVTD